MHIGGVSREAIFFILPILAGFELLGSIASKGVNFAPDAVFADVRRFRVTRKPEERSSSVHAYRWSLT
jgi:hypothetical protein